MDLMLVPHMRISTQEKKSLSFSPFRICHKPTGEAFTKRLRGATAASITVSLGLIGQEYRNIFHELSDLPSPHDNVFRNACFNIQSFLNHNSIIQDHLYPAEQYVKDQINLFLLSLLGEVNKRNFTCGLLREGVENLYHMASYLYTVEISLGSLAASDLCSVILILEMVLNLAETLAGVANVNYTRVREFISAQFPDLHNVERSFPYGKAKYFRIQKLLGAGGFGAVYQAFVGNIECAMKHVPLRLLPDPENATVDKKVASLINHNCLVNYLACFCTEESYVTVMEFIRGVDVIKLLRKCGKLPKELVKIILAQLGLAVQHMHYKGFIHRDVKPANMMILRGCRVKLFDFDTAKVSYGKHHKKYMFYFSRKTSAEFRDGEIAGTIAYMAPEVFQKESYGRAADWYSVGVTGFELSCGKLPFRVDGKSFSDQKQTILQGRLIWPKTHEDFILQLFVDYCMRSKRHRLCTKRYLEFLYHPYFDEVPWDNVENGQPLMEFEPLNQMLATQFGETTANPPAAGASVILADPANSVMKRVELLFGNTCPEFHENPDQKPMFVYSSLEFRRLVETLTGCQASTTDHVRKPPERVYTSDTKENFEFEGV